MQNVILSLLIDFTMVLLLVVTILYCRKLNQRIRVLQDSRSELAGIIREFNESTERATQSIAEIHEASRRISENIQHKIDKANYLVADLEAAIGRGSRAVEGVDIATATGTSTARPRARAAAADPAPATSARPVRPRSRAEQDVLDALKNRGE
jgi:hypothetical protein